MDPLTIGALISGGSSLLGGLLGKSSADAAREQQMQIANQNVALQKQFAQQGIQWKVEDAKAAGIHPLYALGAQTHSFSPVSVGSSADNSLGEGIAKMGQDIGRAVGATGDKEARGLQLLGLKLDIEKKGLENDVLRAEIASQYRKLSQPGTGPSVPFPVSRPVDPKVKPEDATASFRLFGKSVLNDPYTSDAQVAEDVMGEGVADWLWPFVKIPSLMWYNRGDSSRFKFGRRPGGPFN